MTTDTTPTATNSDDEQPLVEGRLHPSSMFIHLVGSFLRNVWVYAFLVWQMLSGDGAAAAELGWELWALIFAGLFTVSSSVVEYLTCRYQLTPRHLFIRRGYLRRLERRIPIDRIQDLTAGEGVLQRMFGVVKVAVQTSSTKGAEASLDSITPSALAALRQELQQVQTTADTGKEATAAPDPELISISTWQLTQRGLTDGRAALVLLIIGGVFAQMFEVANLAVVKPIIAWGEGFFSDLQQHSVLSLAVAAVILGLVLWIAGLVASAIANVFRFHGFTLTDTDGTLRRRYGLLNRQEHTLPRSRIQGMRIKQSLLRRLFNLAELKIHSMGTATDNAAARQAGTNVFVPIGRRERLETLVCQLLPGVDHRGLEWQPISQRIIRRYFTRGLLLAGVVLAAGLPTVGLPALTALGLPLVFAALALAIHRTTRWGVSDVHPMMAVRKGVFGRQLALIPLNRVQGVTVTSTPLERLQDLATLYVILGGGAAVSVPYLTTDQAAQLQQRLARTTSELINQVDVDVPAVA